jgi:hypothetical protein
MIKFLKTKQSPPGGSRQIADHPSLRKGWKMIDTLMYAKELEAAGVQREQAETHVRIMAQIVESDLATKQDVLNLGTYLQRETTQLRGSVQQDIYTIKQDFARLENELQKVEYRLTIKTGLIVTTVVTAAVAVLTLLLKA